MSRIQKIDDTVLSIMVGRAIIVALANTFTECDDYDDATCILEQIVYENEVR